jgi:hypothetical protein
MRRGGSTCSCEAGRCEPPIRPQSIVRRLSCPWFRDDLAASAADFPVQGNGAMQLSSVSSIYNWWELPTELIMRIYGLTGHEYAARHTSYGQVTKRSWQQRQAT